MRKPALLILALLLVAAALLWPRLTRSPDVPATATGTTTAQPAPPAAPSPRPGDLPAPPSTTLPESLPREAYDTIRLIQRGGPFPHRQDGGVFGNRENRLPRKPRGYYREYTVDTPGLSHRGARRIVTGGDPPEVWYYSDDHYDSFRAFDPGDGARR